MKKTTVTITHWDNLNIEAVKTVPNLCAKYHSDCEMEYNGRKANIKSLMEIMAFFIPDRKEVTISCEGDDEDTAIVEIEAFLRSKGIIA